MEPQSKVLRVRVAVASNQVVLGGQVVKRQGDEPSMAAYFRISPRSHGSLCGFEVCFPTSRLANLERHAYLG